MSKHDKCPTGSAASRGVCTCGKGRIMKVLGEPDKTLGRIGRNEPCPCGSGKKWKKCCGARP